MEKTIVEVWLRYNKIGEYFIEDKVLMELKRIIEKAGYKIEMKRVTDNRILWLV